VIEILFYRTRENKCPVQDYLDSLNAKQAAKALWTFRLIRSVNPVPAQYFQKMQGTDDLWEVRVIFAGDIFRFLGFRDKKGNLIICHGFTKKAQKTPAREIEIAEGRKAEYEKR